MKTTISGKLDTVNFTINKANTDIVAAINAMKTSNDIKNNTIIINEQGNPAWGSTAFIPTFENAAYG